MMILISTTPTIADVTKVYGGTFIKGSKMSQFTKDLEEFAVRLGKDGYPTALIERAAERMLALENEVVRLTQEKIINP